jgi:hypothetical protein
VNGATVSTAATAGGTTVATPPRPLA